MGLLRSHRQALFLRVQGLETRSARRVRELQPAASSHLRREGRIPAGGPRSVLLVNSGEAGEERRSGRRDGASQEKGVPAPCVQVLWTEQVAEGQL